MDTKKEEKVKSIVHNTTPEKHFQNQNMSSEEEKIHLDGAKRKVLVLGSLMTPFYYKKNPTLEGKIIICYYLGELGWRPKFNSLIKTSTNWSLSNHEHIITFKTSLSRFKAY